MNDAKQRKSYRQYNPKTGMLIRHRIYRGGREAIQNVSQMQGDVNEQNQRMIGAISIRLGSLAANMQAVQQFIKQVAEMSNPANQKLPPKQPGGKLQ